MIQKALTLSIVLLVILSSCTAQATPTTNPVDTQHTAEAMASTIIAQTQAAVPSPTLVPPSETPTLTPLPSGTPLASPTLLATLSPQASATNQDACNKTLTVWEGPSANFDIVYEYKPQGKKDNVVLSLWVSTSLGECGFLADVSHGPAGQYTAVAFVNGKKDFKVSGSFYIREGNWTLIVRNESIVAQGGCYPHC